MDGGEGHFVAKMVKQGTSATFKLDTLPFSKNKLVDQFLKENCINEVNYTVINDIVYVSQKPLLKFTSGVVRQGVMLGEITNTRFEPHHHQFVSCLMKDDYQRSYDIDDEEILKLYLTGNSLPIKGYQGYTQITYKGHGIGFGKGDGRQIKNKLP